MRLTIAWLTPIVIVALVAAFFLSTDAEANHGAPYSQNVREARQWAREHTTDRGWRCLDRLIHAESGWSVHAVTPKWASPRTGAFGLGQAYPGRKMIRVIGWRDRYVGREQIRWVLVHYIRPRYGSACAARWFQISHRWY